MNSLLVPRLVIFAVGVVAFFVGVYFNKRDDERDNALYEEQSKRAREREETISEFVEAGGTCESA